MSSNEEKSGFKFVDRRRFNEEGEERDSDAVEQAPPALKAESVSKEPERPPVDFSLFLNSLAHQALMAMGMVPWPNSGLIEQRLEVARETIDLIGLLQEKTKGNLTPEEAALTDALLHELRMAFVQVASLPPQAS